MDIATLKHCNKCGGQKHEHEMCLTGRLCKKCKNAEAAIYRAKNRDKILAGLREYYWANRDKSNRARRENYKKNIERERENKRQYRKENPEACSESFKRWAIKNRDAIRRHSNNAYKRIKLRPDVVILRAYRTRVHHALFGQQKKETTLQLIGCNALELKAWLESKFKPGMTWENYGPMGWHIDHIKPCASFDFAKEKDRLDCFHYTNLQPLWWKENLSKGAKI